MSRFGHDRPGLASLCCMFVLAACCTVIPSAHATKCTLPVEEKPYELVEVRAMDGGSVPARIQSAWADGASVVARGDGIALHLGDEGMILEEVGP